ncbi:MAG TPA: mechanosensitive ion channel [Gammaproteobacteria bacterium]|nr:mechanosensitive ion channel [Gammaproteobacteria bacterium]
MESITNIDWTDPGVIQSLLIPWGIRLGIALAIFIVGRWIARWLTNMVRKLMTRASLDDMLINFLGNLVYTVLILVVVMATLDQLGIETTSLLAVFGAAGLAIGLALKDSLSNFSSGVMIILFRPFKVGDFIEAGGATGVVEEVRMFATIMRTGDNRQIIIPNGQIYGGTITNYSAKPTRRIDLVFGIGYGDDIAKAKKIIDDIMQQDERILSDPAPGIALGELADSSVNFNVRPWVKNEDYWPVRADLLEKVKLAFDANGISIPYPQQDVYMHNVA